MPDQPPRPRVTYLLGTAALAGVTGAGFAALAAHALGLSMVIAGATSGILLAAVVGAVIYKYGEASAQDAPSPRVPPPGSGGST